MSTRESGRGNILTAAKRGRSRIRRGAGRTRRKSQLQLRQILTGSVQDPDLARVAGSDTAAARRSDERPVVLGQARHLPAQPLDTSLRPRSRGRARLSDGGTALPFRPPGPLAGVLRVPVGDAEGRLEMSMPMTLITLLMNPPLLWPERTSRALVAVANGTPAPRGRMA